MSLERFKKEITTFKNSKSTDLRRAKIIKNRSDVRIYIDQSEYGLFWINGRYVVGWWHPWMQLNNPTFRIYSSYPDAKSDLFKAISYHNFFYNRDY